MEYAHNLLDVLRILPVDARAAAFGESFSRRLAGCRLACRDLQQLHDSSITHVRLQPPAKQQPGLASPLAKFVRCSRLDVHGACYNIDPVSCTLAGTTPAARERITHLAVSGRVSNRLVGEAVAAQLPSLEVLELVCSEGFGACNQQGGICRILGGGLPNLQRLTLAQATEADLADLGALAACPQLRELALPTPLTGDNANPMRAALESLAQLQRLERLKLGMSIFTCSSGAQQLLTSLLASRSHRPPQLRTLMLVWSHNATPTLEVAFAPMSGTRAKGAKAVGWGMSCIHLGFGWIQRAESVFVPALLAAADSLKQLTIPQLIIREHYWTLARGALEPQAALPRLLARCERVEVDYLPSVCDSGFRDHHSRSVELLSAARLMGWPRVLDLRHGAWLCRDALLGVTGVTAEAAAAATSTGTAAQGPDGRELGLMPQQLGQGSGTGDGHRSGGVAASVGGGRPPLHLDTAGPGEVLREVVERLWVGAVRANGVEESTGGGANDVDSSFAYEGAASGSTMSTSGSGGTDNVEPLSPGLLLLRGKLPPAPKRSSLPGQTKRDADWAGWVENALSSCFAAPMAWRPSWQRLPDNLHNCIRDGTHVVAPATGWLLLECRSQADAELLAALASASGGATRLSAVAVPPDAGRSFVSVLKSQVLQVRRTCSVLAFLQAICLPAGHISCFPERIRFLGPDLIHVLDLPMHARSAASRAISLPPHPLMTGANGAVGPVGSARRHWWRRSWQCGCQRRRQRRRQHHLQHQHGPSSAAWDQQPG